MKPAYNFNKGNRNKSDLLGKKIKKYGKRVSFILRKVNGGDTRDTNLKKRENFL